MTTGSWAEPFRTAEQELRVSGRKLWLAVLGSVATVEESAGDLFDDLIERGRKLEKTSRSAIKRTRSEVEAATEELGDRLEGGVSDALVRLGVPSRTQVEDLISRIDRLSAKIDSLSG